MILHTRSALNSLKVSEECQGYKLDFLEAQIYLRQMLTPCFYVVPTSDLESPARKDDGLLGVVTLWLQHATVALLLL